VPLVLPSKRRRWNLDAQSLDDATPEAPPTRWWEINGRCTYEVDLEVKSATGSMG
jgi:hypothetical protein